MFGFLSIDGPFYKTLTKITNYMILGFLWLLGCVPIITVGASCTALYATHHKVVKNGNGYIWRTFWEQFRSNFKQATLLWLIILLLGGFFAADYYLLYMMSGAGNSSVVLTVFLIFVGMCAMWIQYWFPYIAHIEDPIKTVLKNTLILCFAHFPQSLLITLVFGLLWFVNLGLPLMPYFIILGPLSPIIYCLLTYGRFRRVFSNYWDMTDGNAQLEEEKEEE